jgi:hypothetical protein
MMSSDADKRRSKSAWRTVNMRGFSLTCVWRLGCSAQVIDWKSSSVSTHQTRAESKGCMKSAEQEHTSPKPQRSGQEKWPGTRPLLRWISHLFASKTPLLCLDALLLLWPPKQQLWQVMWHRHHMYLAVYPYTCTSALAGAHRISTAPGPCPAGQILRTHRSHLGPLWLKRKARNNNIVIGKNYDDIILLGSQELSKWKAGNFHVILVSKGKHRNFTIYLTLFFKFLKYETKVFREVMNKTSNNKKRKENHSGRYKI